MPKIAVNKEVLLWAIERSGATMGLLEPKFPKIERWLAGKDSPTLRQLEDFARATMTPFGYFFLSEPPVERLPIPHFRTIADSPLRRPSPDLLETVHTMERRQAWMREFLIEEGVEQLPFVRSLGPNENIRQVAETIRDTMGFKQGWAAQQPTWEAALQTLREAIEGAGILVVVNGIVGNNTHRKLEPDEFRGFVLVDEYAPLVFINGADGKAAQMFTLAHELAHVWFGISAAFDLREMRPANDPTEIACNKVAAEFLVPEAELRQVWPSASKDTEPFQFIARRFKISAIVGARRALDLQLINRKTFFEFYQAYLEDERRAKKKQAGGDFYLNQNQRVGRRFAETVIRAVKEGKLLYNDAYRLTGLYGKVFDTYSQNLGFEVSG